MRGEEVTGRNGEIMQRRGTCSPGAASRVGRLQSAHRRTSCFSVVGPNISLCKALHFGSAATPMSLWIVNIMNGRWGPKSGNYCRVSGEMRSLLCEVTRNARSGWLVAAHRQLGRALTSPPDIATQQPRHRIYRQHVETSGLKQTDLRPHWRQSKAVPGSRLPELLSIHIVWSGLWGSETWQYWHLMDWRHRASARHQTGSRCRQRGRELTGYNSQVMGKCQQLGPGLGWSNTRPRLAPPRVRCGWII